MSIESARPVKSKQFHGRRESDVTPGGRAVTVTDRHTKKNDNIGVAFVAIVY